MVRNPVALAVYTFSHSRYMFPVLLELAIVPILPQGGVGVVPDKQKPAGAELREPAAEPQIIRVNPEGAGRVARR